jgi:hypothetical protein
MQDSIKAKLWQEMQGGKQIPADPGGFLANEGIDVWEISIARQEKPFPAAVSSNECIQTREQLHGGGKIIFLTIIMECRITIKDWQFNPREVTVWVPATLTLEVKSMASDLPVFKERPLLLYL